MDSPNLQGQKSPDNVNGDSSVNSPPFLHFFPFSNCFTSQLSQLRSFSNTDLITTSFVSCRTVTQFLVVSTLLLGSKSADHFSPLAFSAEFITELMLAVLFWLHLEFINAVRFSSIKSSSASAYVLDLPTKQTCKRQVLSAFRVKFFL